MEERNVIQSREEELLDRVGPISEKQKAHHIARSNYFSDQVVEQDSLTLEEGSEPLLDFKKLKKISKLSTDVIPVAVQDIDSKEVLMIGYVNEEALNQTIEKGRAVFWSTSRDELHIKGETSGDRLEIKEIRVNCEQNSLLYIVRKLGNGVCHTKNTAGNHRKSCFYRKLKNQQLVFLE